MRFDVSGLRLGWRRAEGLGRRAGSLVSLPRKSGAEGGRVPGLGLARAKVIVCSCISFYCRFAEDAFSLYLAVVVSCAHKILFFAFDGLFSL